MIFQHTTKHIQKQVKVKSVKNLSRSPPPSSSHHHSPPPPPPPPPPKNTKFNFQDDDENNQDKNDSVMVTALSIVIGINLVATVSHLDKSIRANKEEKEKQKRNIKDAKFYLNYCVWSQLPLF